jgi:hypothetical protein
MGQAVEQLEGGAAKHFAAVHIGHGEPVDQASLRRGERLETGGGDRRHRLGDTSALRWSLTIGGRYGKGLGHARPCPNPPETRVLRHGWISHGPPFPEMRTKQKSRCDGPGR